MVNDDAGKGLVVECAEVLVGAFAVDEMLVGYAILKGDGAIFESVVRHLSQVFVGFEHGIIDEEFSLIGGIVQMIKEFCDGVEMEGVVLWLEVEDVENIGVFS